MEKFDTLVESTLKDIYCEMLASNQANKTTQLTEPEKEAVTDAVDNVAADPTKADPEQKRLADLAARRKQQLKLVAQPATQKLQQAVTQPITR
jgi:hypothetical protein